MYRRCLAFRLVVVGIHVSVAVVALLPYSATSARAADDPLARLETNLPSQPAHCVEPRIRELIALAREVEERAAGAAWKLGDSPDEILAGVERLVGMKERIDAARDRLLNLRTQFAVLAPGKQRREMLRQFLTAASQLIDLSGRLRYLLSDAVATASRELTPHDEKLDALIDLLTRRKVAIGAAVMSYGLYDPPAGSTAKPFSVERRYKLINLIYETQQVDLVPQLADFVRDEKTAPPLVVVASIVIRRLGLPQDALPSADPSDAKPVITAKELHGILSRLDDARLSRSMQQHRADLLGWLDRRMKYGVLGETFRYGSFLLREGDWLLMRNPSPYNLFTDLAPGLFTHVGVVAARRGSDGIRRFVIVDLPERGARVPETNVDAYLRRTLHYFFVRHKDPAVGKKMGEVAVSLIGNETEFDLMFRTDRVAAFKNQPLAGKRINTYCAGFLLLCAQETTAPRDEFFPIEEYPAGGHCLNNLNKLGLSIGDHFVSPTGAIFSSHLDIVGRCEPMYDPTREIKELVYDHFAKSMVDKELVPSPSAYQLLREKVASVSKYNAWLARALARVNNVSEHMDLESAAKAAAVVETLDEIADESMEQYMAANRAMRAGPDGRLAARGLKREEIEQVRRYRKQHDEVFRRWTSGKLTPRELRIELVKFYADRGRKKLNDRFFPDA